MINTIGRNIALTETQIWFLFKSGFASSFFPVMNPTVIEVIHRAKKVKKTRRVVFYSTAAI